jgi:hypothetical protein
MIKPSNTTENIINLLGTSWPLSLKEISAQLHKYSESKVTYQAIHKQVKQLVEEKVLEKGDNKYKINVDWIKKEKDYFAYLEDCYLNKRDIFVEIQKTGFISHSFNFSVELGKLLLDFFTKLPNPENKSIIFRQTWLYPPFSLSTKEYDQMIGVIKSTKVYLTAENETLMDKSFKEEYESLGAKVKTKIKNSNPYDTIVHGDYIMFIYFPEGFLTRWEKSCKKSKGSKHILFGKMLFLLYKYRKKFNLTIIKNQENADQIRTETLKLFKKRK